MNIYLDHAATTPVISEVFEAMKPLYCKDFGNPDSLHAFGRQAAAHITNARDTIAHLLGVSPLEVYFTAGGTEAANWAIRGMGAKKALISPIEHACVMSSAPLREGGFTVCSVGENGIVTREQLEAAMTDEIGLVAVMAVNNETGCVQPVSELAEIAHARGALFFCDCVQAACSQDLRSIAKSADALSLSAHKIGGPKGVGALIVKKGVKIRPLIAGGEQERGLRGGTLNAAAIVGFAKALELAVSRREDFCTHTRTLRDLFEKKLITSLGERIKIDGENRAPNISHITFERGGEALLNLLDLKGVAASGGAACSAHAALPSHVLVAMGRSAEEAKRGIRFSFGMQNTEEEVLRAAEIVVDCLK